MSRLFRAANKDLQIHESHITSTNSISRSLYHRLSNSYYDGKLQRRVRQWCRRLQVAPAGHPNYCRRRQNDSYFRCRIAGYAIEDLFAIEDGDYKMLGQSSLSPDNRYFWIGVIHGNPSSSLTVVPYHRVGFHFCIWKGMSWLPGGNACGTLVIQF